MPFLKVREPIVRHELNPKGCQHVKEWGFPVLTVGLWGPIAIPVVAGLGVRFIPSEELSTDHLRIRLQQTETIAMPIPRDLLPSQIRERCFKLSVPREQLMRRSHEGIVDIVTDA